MKYFKYTSILHIYQTFSWNPFFSTFFFNEYYTGASGLKAEAKVLARDQRYSSNAARDLSQNFTRSLAPTDYFDRIYASLCVCGVTFFFDKNFFFLVCFLTLLKKNKMKIYIYFLLTSFFFLSQGTNDRCTTSNL